jgi:chloramphenicol 3-O-phosphotransferase
MRTAITVAVLAALLMVLNGGAEAGQTCIAKATEALPRITGLVVKKSRTRAVSPEILASWKGQSRPIIIDVDVEDSGEAQTYSYMCVITQGSAFVQRTMN